MGAYLIKRLLLIIPTLFGIMLINFAIVQFVPGGPVEQLIAQMTGTAVESTARFSGSNLPLLLKSIYKKYEKCLINYVTLCEKFLYLTT